MGEADSITLLEKKGIPERFLRCQGEQKEAHIDQQRETEEIEEDIDSDEEDSISQSSASDDSFDADIVALRNLCFISVGTDRATFEMLMLVQLATQKWLQANGQLERWKQQFLSNVLAEFPTAAYENWAVCQALFAHAKVSDNRPSYDTLATPL
ncbi:hypothetical protein T440DRAFT_484385 [Plenodomus tracheiphilus IPT5]|uniref:Uncharacterized protein n=1 Tax=Plenodomus tracheiphilus IPT5 TaxID=1408161 RepID=A0A6A7AMH3_9PLEO|nr:hypothetical protein T440DRAFT_484385 [Plenodomus tracheiphilus IPT5]